MSDSPVRKLTSPRVSPRAANLILACIMLAGLLFRLYAAQDLRWSSDTVPIIDIGQRFFHEGIFPLHGSLSSVAAYNMPGLVYLFMPAMLLTDDPARIIILTALALNLIGILLVYRLCAEFFDREIGLVAAALYTFSTISIESAYTAWAQMNVGVFFTATIYFLYRWAVYGRGRDMMAAVMVAVIAFTIHFAAIALAVVVAVFYLLTRPPIRVKWIVASTIGAMMLLAPYVYFEITRDFVDVRAFVSRKDLVPPQVWVQVDQQRTRDFARASSVRQADSGPDNRPGFIEQAIKAVGGVFEYAWHWYGTEGTEPLPLSIAALVQTLFCLAGIALTWIDLIPRISLLIRRGGGRRTTESLTSENEVYRRSLLVIVYVIFVLSLILTDNSPFIQTSYFWGMIGLQIIIVAYTLVRICRILPRFVGAGILVGLVVWIGVIQVTDFAQMVEFNRLNGHVYSYRDAKRAVDWIAADWRGKHEKIGKSGLTLSISYDMLPEAPDWWIAAFHAVDPAYHIGMTFNALLRSQHNIVNSNTSADGLADRNDYLVVYRSGQWRYAKVEGTRNEFGQIVVIAP